MSGEWWLDSGEIARLLRWLEKEDGLDVADCIAIVEKPWHWDTEYSDMCRAQMSDAERRDAEDLAKGEADADSEEQR